MQKKDLEKIHDYLWEVPKHFRPDMRVPARVYTTEKMLDAILNDRSLEQLAKSSESATRLVNQLLALARAENQPHAGVPYIALDLNEVARAEAGAGGDPT